MAGALRLYYSIITQKSNDTPWEGFNLWTWESVEINLGIVCASAPCLKSLVTRIIPKIFPSQNNSSYGRGYALGSIDGTGRRPKKIEEGCTGQENLTELRKHHMFASVKSDHNI